MALALPAALLHAQAPVLPSAEPVPTPAPLEPASLATRMPWREIVRAVRQLPDAVADATGGWRDALTQAAPHWPLLLGALSAMLLVMAAARWWAEPALRTRMQRRWPAQPLAQSLPGLSALLLQTVLAWMLGSLLLQIFNWAARPSGQVLSVARMLVVIVTLAVLVAALGRACLRLLASRNPTLFKPGLLRSAPVWLALSLVAVALLDQHAMQASAAGGSALRTLAPLLTAAWWALLIGLLLLNLAAALQSASVSLLALPERRTLHVLRAVLLLGWLLVAVLAGSLLAGYVDAAALLAKQAVWSVLVLALLYLCWQVLRDATDALIGRREALLQWSRRLGMGTRRLQQALVLASGALMLTLACFATMLLTAGYGLGPADVLGRVVDNGGRLHVGSISLSPMQILRAALVLAVAVAVTRLLARWLARRLLPTTRIEASVQSSLTTIVGYIGVVIGIGLALAALGVQASRIAWVVSALTVGIGFGLQAIVQNFISGIILLVERPVKVGDWVVVGDAEGDVRRINVRATEISLPDRTTVLVPNSELITKAVRNRTFAASDGLVKILLPVAASASIEQVMPMLQSVLQAHREVKSAPAPRVQVEDIKDNKIWIGASAYVDGPRQVARIRGELLYAALQKLQAAGVALG